MREGNPNPNPNPDPNPNPNPNTNLLAQHAQHVREGEHEALRGPRGARERGEVAKDDHANVRAAVRSPFPPATSSAQGAAVS